MPVPAGGLLSNFLQIRATDVDALQRTVQPLYGTVRFDIRGRPQDFNVTANHCQLGAVGLTCGVHGTAIGIALPHFESTALLFSYRGAARVTRNGRDCEVDTHQAFVASPGDRLQLDYASDFAQFVLKIETSALLLVLEALTGKRAKSTLQFDSRASLARRETRNLHQRVLRLAHWLDRHKGTLSPVAVAELEQSLLTSFLLANRNSYSDLLDTRPQSMPERRLARVEAYIEAHWDRPLSIAALAQVSGESARTVFYDFHRKHGCSPMTFVKLLRLSRAFSLLAKPGPGASVTDVAFACGFGNLGHFAHYYRQQFGELPSDTLRRARPVAR
jgi:AraC-like DNA-binding protein